mmetsp:Transcript_7997/g.12909  ORF Transcript_7997/g.12909 Transcript_7997/m.12909 type:complete len:489 (-) Transcript_7997:176-1642(-)
MATKRSVGNTGSFNNNRGATQVPTPSVGEVQGPHPAKRCCCCIKVRACPEFCRSEGFMIRNEDTPLQVEMYLVCSAVTILLIRIGLYATGYPQLGGNGIHIAHMLWGGLLMFVAQMLSFSFLGRHIQRLASVIGGIGFGMFIDELGKFVTSNNDYFFKPTPFILYIGFCVLFIALKCVEPMFHPSRFTENENLANALNLLGMYSTSGLSIDSRLLLLELLENSDQNHPVVPHLKEYLHLPVSASGLSTSREHYYLRFRNWIGGLYTQLVRNRYFVYIIDSFFILQCAMQIIDLSFLLIGGGYYNHEKVAKETTGGAGDDGFWQHLLDSPLFKALREISSGKLSDTLLTEETDHVTKLHIFQLIAVGVSAFCVLLGVFFLSVSCGPCNRRTRYLHSAGETDFAPMDRNHWTRRKRAFVWFRRSMLVRLFITDSLSLYHSQFRAFGDVIFTISIVMALSFMITQEESTDRRRRLSASGSLDEIELTNMIQ